MGLCRGYTGQKKKWFLGCLLGYSKIKVIVSKRLFGAFAFKRFMELVASKWFFRFLLSNGFSGTLFPNGFLIKSSRAGRFHKKKKKKEIFFLFDLYELVFMSL